jgi:MFS family permease
MSRTSQGIFETNETPTLFHPAFVLLNLAYFLVFSNVALFYLYPVALDEMGAGKHTIGWVMGVFSLAAVLSRPLMGVIAARRGEFLLMSGGMVVMLTASVCYPFLGSVGAAMLGVRVAHGLGFSGFVAGSFSAVALLFPGERRAAAYSIVGASLMSAMALAPPAGELLIERFGFGALFLCASGLILLAWASVTGAAGSAGKAERPRSRRGAPYSRLLGDGSFLLLLTSTLIFAHCQSTLLNFLALAAEQRDAPAGPFFFMAFATAIAVLLTMGRIIDRKGKRRFLRLFYPAFALGLILLPPFLGGLGQWTPALLFGLGLGFLFPAHNALAAGYGGRDEKAGVMALFTAVYDSGFISGAVVSGWIAALLGLDGLFYATGGLALLGFVVCLGAPIREGGG